MANKITQLHNVNPEELISNILKGVENILIKNTNTKTDSEKLLTRNEVSEFLSISLPTLRSYVKRGLIKEYRIGSRVLYKSSEVLEALPATNRK